MFIERKGLCVKPIFDLSAGEVFEYDNHILVKTNKSDGFDEKGSYTLVVDLCTGELISLHENMMVSFIQKSKVVIE